MILTLEEANSIMTENNGSLYLRNTSITKLPDNLKVGGDLDLSFTELTELPENLTVGGWLDLCSTKITELPENRFIKPRKEEADENK